MLDANTNIVPTPVDKRCRSCGQTKILSEYDFSQRSKDGRMSVCKSCKEQRQQKRYQTCTCGCCTCSCDLCKDSKMLMAAAPLIELVLTRVYDGLKVSPEFRKLVLELASALLDQEVEDNKNKDNSNGS